MEQEKKTDSNLADEFRQLGKNLSEVLNAAWESPERKRLQEEISSGLSELNRILRDEARHISESPTGQRVKAEAGDFRQRMRSGEVESRAREELLTVLKNANELLRKAVERMSEGRRAEDAPESSRSGSEAHENPAVRREDVESTPMKDTGHREVHPDDVESDVNQGTGHQEIHPDDVESS
jgi:hypothetical protein